MNKDRDQPVGEGSYVVRAGECVGSISAEHGLFWETLWNHEGNRGVREARKDPMVLLAGDRLTIPEKRKHQESSATEKRHRFRRKGIPAKLRLRFLDEDEPVANVPCLVLIEGRSQELETDSNGMLELAVPPGAREGSVQAGEGEEQVTYELDLGHLDPYDTVRGVQQRLRNLGLFEGEANGELNPETSEGVIAAQRLADLEQTGEIDDALCEKLRETNGS